MQHFPTGHKDLVLSIDYNLYGTRMVTAGADHLLKVWSKDDTNQDWTVLDTWLAHDAEVTEVKWTYPFVGEHIGSIGEDGLLKIWRENINHAPNSGRRFAVIFTMTTPTGLPFMSLDFKSIASETYLAAATRDGYLVVYEPEDEASLASWKPFWHDYLCATPSRMNETSFRVSWHKEKLPAWPAVYSGLDRKSLAFAVSVGDTVRVYRTDKDRQLYVAAVLDGAGDLVRDVDWANGSMRGFDCIATASKDGSVRIYELHTPATSSGARASLSHVAASQTAATRPARSGIGAGLAITKDSVPTGPVQDVKLVAELDLKTAMPWRLKWSFNGDVLLSTGDDATIRMWKKAVEGKWVEAIEIDTSRA